MRTEGFGLVAIVLALGCAEGGGGDDGGADTTGETDAADSTDAAWDTTTDPGEETGDAPDAAEDPDAADVETGDTVGLPCDGNWDCQDGVYCNGVEYCEGGVCHAGMEVNCDDGYDCTRDDCVESTRECTHTPDDEECSDGLACNGVETCTGSLGCEPGTPVDCDDGVLCTLDRCTEPGGTCTNTVDDVVCDDADPCTVDECDAASDTCHNTLIDGDGDLFPPASCGGPDCDDADETRHPGADEDCEDGVDSNCNGLPDASDPACCTGSGDTCDCPVDITGGGTVTGSTAGMANDYCGSCGASPCAFDGVDAAFYLWLAHHSLVRWTFSGIDWSFYVHLHEGACWGPEILCADGFWEPEPVVTTMLDPGFYYLILDSEDMIASGDYAIDTLVTTLEPVPAGNEDCATAHPIAPGNAYGGSVDTHTSSHDPSTCATWPSGRDAVFRLDLDVATDVDITTDGTLWDTVLYVYDASCSTETHCDDDGGSGGYNTSRITATLSAGTWYVVLDEYSSYSYGASADYILTVASD